jgi:hypothetical protein
LDLVTIDTKTITLLFHEFSNDYISEVTDFKDKEKRLKKNQNSVLKRSWKQIDC